MPAILLRHQQQQRHHPNSGSPLNYMLMINNEGEDPGYPYEYASTRPSRFSQTISGVATPYTYIPYHFPHQHLPLHTPFPAILPTYTHIHMQVTTSCHARMPVIDDRNPPMQGEQRRTSTCHPEPRLSILRYSCSIDCTV
jgi:hypothetical protein